jgi:hypothetical protein
VLGSEVQDIFTTILSEKVIMSLVEKSGLQERVRKLDALALVRAMIIAASTGYGGRQADVMRAYFENGAPRVVRGAFYGWFGEELERIMTEVSSLAVEYVARQPVDLPKSLTAHVKDWHIVDSTTVKLDDRLRDEYPGAGAYAALKIHKRFSVGIGTVLSYRIGPAKEHDVASFQIDESWRGLGVLLDLGYASFKLIRDCAAHDVQFVIRLKESWKPKVQHVSRGTVNMTFFQGSDLDALLDSEALVLDGKVIDADVSFGTGKATVYCRLVGVPAPDKGYRFYLTSLPRTVGPHQVADLYRVRWEIESDNKLNKSCFHLDEIAAQTGPNVRSLVHASMVSSILACLLAHMHRRAEKPPAQEGTERTTAPIHPQSVARAMASASQSIAAAMTLTGSAAKREWERLAEYLTHLGKDPNWRRNPSVLDQLRGWKTSPGTPKRSRLSSAAEVN